MKEGVEKMIKGTRQQKKRLLQRSIIVSILVFLIAGVSYYLFQAKNEPIEKVKASTVVKTGEFRLKVDNKWDDTSKSNYAELNWDPIPNASYRMFQSKDGTSWNSRSIKYNKHLKVLNIYPDSQYVITHTGDQDYADTLKGWIGSLNHVDENGDDYITIDSVRLSDFNADPNQYLTDAYDVLYVGTFNSNGHQDTNAAGTQAIRRFADTGRGVLFGHDVVAAVPGLPYFNSFSTELGLSGPVSWIHVNGVDVKVVNNGFMMQYPYELSKNAKLNVPWTHNSQYFNQNISEEAIIWMTFNQVNYNPGNGYAPFYFATKKNFGMIQTADHRADGSIPAGHPVLSITEDECRILVNALYHFAQVTTETSAFDYTVSDEEKPVVDGALIRCGSTGGINVLVEGTDKGSEYQWYIEALANGNTKKSDVVKEEIKSNIFGYFYEVSDSPTSSLETTVEGYKNEFGRITKDMLKDTTKNGVLVAPDGNLTEYQTDAAFSINENASSEKYVHLVAVDRASNVSEVKSLKISDMIQPVDFQIERTEDEAKIVDLTLDTSIDSKMKSIEVQVPKNTVIKGFSSLTLPSTWYSFQNSGTADYDSYSFSMESNNSVATMKTFLEALRFTIKDPVNNSGDIKIILHEKVYTSWIDPQGVVHYYTFISTPAAADKKTWLQAYNQSKKLTYRGLTGYLATLTSEEEHDFVYNNIAKTFGWLGGTRLVKTKPTVTRINDEEAISTSIGDYSYATNIAPEWYWVDGPEAGQTFFTTPTLGAGGKAPDGVYQGFNTIGGEPSNGNGTGEYCLQFAQWNTGKLWNDISFNRLDHVAGYYVEFSQYGNQEEGEEPTDRCWSAAIPQKISVKSYDDQGMLLPGGDILKDQELRINKVEAIQPKELEFYSFIEAREMDDTPRGISYTVSDTYQEGKLIYSTRKLNLNVRQVIQNSNNKLVIPTEGYLTIQNQLHNNGAPAIDGNYQANAAVSSDEASKDPSFTTIILSTSHLGDDNDEVQLSTIIPEFYKYNGYRISEDLTTHTSAPVITDEKISLSRLDIYNHGEYWITIYLEPNGTNGGKSQPYSWDYKRNDLGTIKTK